MICLQYGTMEQVCSDAGTLQRCVLKQILCVCICETAAARYSEIHRHYKARVWNL
jgi:hypothetical protein